MKRIFQDGLVSIAWYLSTGIIIVLISALWIIYFSEKLDSRQLATSINTSALLIAFLSEGLRRYRKKGFLNFAFPVQHSLKNLQEIAMGNSRPTHTVRQVLYPVPAHLKSSLLLELLKKTGTNSALIFAHTKYRAQKIKHQIESAGYTVTSLYSDHSEGKRRSVPKGFKDGTYQIMVATDIAARGLNMESVSHVINYDMPDTADAYLLRIGHTGNAFSLVTDEDDDMIRILERTMGSLLKRETIGGFDYTATALPKTKSRSRGRGALRDDSRRPLRPTHTVRQVLYPVPAHLKTQLLLALLKKTDTSSVLIFARTKHRAHKVAQQIERAGHKVTSLHGDHSQGQRTSALKGFKDGTHQIMVATAIAARGLDVESISHVINYDMPDTADEYIHRIGRTGRAQLTGDAFTLVTHEDNDMIRILERIMGSPIKRETLDGFDYTAPAPPRTAGDNRGRGAPREDSRRPRRPAATSKSYGRNRLAPRKR